MSDPSLITKTVSLITIANVDSRGSRLVKFIVTIFSAFAIDPDEQRLSEIIVTGLSVGFVLSKTTWEASVVELLPFSGLPCASMNEISNSIIPSVNSVSCSVSFIALLDGGFHKVKCFCVILN